MRLLCPVCHSPLFKNDRSAVCRNNHHFDYSRDGYLNLLISQKKNHGDNRMMVQARTAFLETDSYGFLRKHLASIAEAYGVETMADLGCGQGYYTSAIPVNEKYGFDLAKDALKYASRHDHTTSYVVASIFHVPLPDTCADMVLTCFAPAAVDEIERLLKPGGIFVLVSPGPDHLFEFKSVLYEKPYRNITEPVRTHMTCEKEELIRKTFKADSRILQDLFWMTPYAYHTTNKDKEKLDSISSLEVTAQFCIRIFRKS
jgi:23S rRNA (guanine745-N1)-methyltransferase